MSVAAPVVTAWSCRRPPSPQANLIIVIGAGLAGLRAADLLRKAGLQVLVLEARGSPGGRVLTIRNRFGEDLYAEAGPIRIAGSHHAVLELVQAHGLGVVPYVSSNGSSIAAVRGIRAQLPDGLDRIERMLAVNAGERGLGQSGLLDRYAGELPADLANPEVASSAAWDVYDRMTWPEWLRSRGASEGAVTLMTLGGDSRELSALYALRQYALLRSTNQFYKIQGGMDLLPAAMASSLGDVVRYNAPVVRIEHGPRSVRVDYRENNQVRSTEAARIIVTIPFSTLRQVDVRPAFSPEKQRAIEELPYFPATRFLIQSRSRFWHASGLSGTARTDRPAEIWDCTYDLGGEAGILGGTVGGAIGTALLDKSLQECVDFGLETVADAFPGIRSEFALGVAHRWALERWSRGAFAVFHRGQMASIMPAVSRPDGRVHFAGEHTSSWIGWMEGALLSAERAAEEVMNAS